MQIQRTLSSRFAPQSATSSAPTAATPAPSDNFTFSGTASKGALFTGAAALALFASSGTALAGTRPVPTLDEMTPFLTGVLVVGVGLVYLCHANRPRPMVEL